MAFPNGSPVNQNQPEVGFQNNQPPQIQATGKKQTIDGQALINAKAPGKLNENRFSSLKPSRNDK